MSPQKINENEIENEDHLTQFTLAENIIVILFRKDFFQRDDESASPFKRDGIPDLIGVRSCNMELNLSLFKRWKSKVDTTFIYAAK
jgi:hypothetical protein